MKILKQFQDGRRNQRKARIILFVTCLLASATLWVYGEITTLVQASEPVSPLGAVQNASSREVPAPKVIELDDIQKTDAWVGQYVDKYFTSHYGRSRVRGIMHCLLTKESEHTFMTADDHHGDNGKAGGALQFHAPTWDSFRKIMVDRGLITEIGSRYNPEQAIETTVWALSDGRELNWGPILRQECLSTKGSK